MTPNKKTHCQRQWGSAPLRGSKEIYAEIPHEMEVLGTSSCEYPRGVSTRILPLMPDQVIAVLEHRLLIVDWDSEMFEADLRIVLIVIILNSKRRFRNHH